VADMLGRWELGKVHNADCLSAMKALPDGCIQCCVTSPPYWGLRDYGTAKWEGGTPECRHEPPQSWIDHNFNAHSAFGNGAKTQGAAAKVRWYKEDGSCPDCGARRVDRQLGLEKSPEEYVAGMVAVFREVRRVLRDDGVLWLNLGDSYNGYMANQRGTGLETKRQSARKYIEPGAGLRTTTLKQKDLVGIPWRVAFALQADGWYLRQDIIWHKPNPVPESVTDRCTKAHEYIFMLTKSARYYYDAEAVAEKGVLGPHTRDRASNFKKCGDTGGFNRSADGNPIIECDGTRNRRSVWTITTKPYAEAHFATFPPAIPETCIKASTHDFRVPDRKSVV